MKVISLLRETMDSIKAKYLGVTIYFMSENKIIRGRVSAIDEFQFFVGDRHAVRFNKDFYLTKEELIKELEEDIIDAL
jgi:hypothetical protein